MLPLSRDLDIARPRAEDSPVLRRGTAARCARAASFACAVGLALVGCHPQIGAVADPERCGGCHRVATRDWRASAHADPARGNPDRTERFAVAFRRASEHPWCASCHLPEPVGVGCGTCHADGARACEDCHQFDVPRSLDEPGVSGGVPSQDTVSEWRRSARADTPCVGCHPPHEAPGVSLLAETVRLDAVRDGEMVDIELRSTGAGHAVPTGDPFRRLRVELLAPWGLAGTATFGRQLGKEADGSWVERADTRIPPPTSGRTASVHQRLLAPDAARWTLDAYLADPAHQGLLADGGVVRLAAGEVRGGQEEP